VKEMFAITQTAALAINAMFSEIPEGAGLRIAYPEGSQKPQLSVALAPSEQDTVVESAGVTMFLEPSVAQTLDDKVLDVHRVVKDDGDLYHFAITAQAAG
jgi:Fe-S cluster assembly iron-binding protein IscA